MKMHIEQKVTSLDLFLSNKIVNNMRIIITFLFVLFVGSAYPQRIIIDDFEELNTDLSARTTPRKSETGEDCALIKVQSLMDDVKFEGDVIGDVKLNMNEYWVYVNPESDFLVLTKRNYVPATVYFEEYDKIGKLSPKKTYQMKIKDDAYSFNEIYKEEYTGIENGYKYIDLGLSVYWAICDVGVSAPQESGIKVAWGECSPKSEYVASNYKLGTLDYGADGSILAMSNSKYDVNDELELVDDVAYRTMHGNWRMPSYLECLELAEKCTFYRAKYKGTDGWVVTGPNGKTLFLANDNNEEVTEYWSSSCGGLYTAWSTNGCYAISLVTEGRVTNNSKWEGLKVRAVKPKL